MKRGTPGSKPTITTHSKAKVAELGDVTRTKLLEKHAYKVVDAWLVILMKKIRFNTVPATRILIID
jgi:hypothetical protein